MVDMNWIASSNIWTVLAERIKFTNEVEKNSVLSFVDVMVLKWTNGTHCLQTRNPYQQISAPSSSITKRRSEDPGDRSRWIVDSEHEKTTTLKQLKRRIIRKAMESQSRKEEELTEPSAGNAIFSICQGNNWQNRMIPASPQHFFKN